MTEKMQNLKNRIVRMYFNEYETLVRARDEDGLQRLTDNTAHLVDATMTANAHLKFLFNLRERLLESRSLSPREATLISVFTYLSFVEGSTCNNLNFISYILIIAGHDLYSLTKRKYVSDDIEEIRKVETSTKIQFLKHHGLGALIKEYNSTLRNDIAHHNYKIDEEGVLWIRGKRVNLRSELPLLRKITKFMMELAEEIDKRTKILHRKLKKELTKA